MEGSGSPVQVRTQRAGAASQRRDYVFYYDGDCGFCTRVVRILAAADLRHRVRWVAFQSLEEYPGGLTRTDLQREAYIRHGDKLEGGFYSFRRLTLLLPPLWPLAPLMWFPGVYRFGEAAYAWVARNRGRLPGSVCSIDS